MLSGAILSGGQSSRMGQEKGLVRLGGEPLIRHVARALANVADEIVVAVAKGRAEEYVRVLDGDFVLAEDREADVGPLEGLITALSSARGDYVLVSPCDTPFLRTAVCEATASRAEGKDGAVPIIRGYQEPLHAVYRRTTALKAFEEALSRGKRRPADGYGALELARVPEEVLRALDPQLESFWNLNTPEDLLQAEERLRRGLG